MKTDAMYFENTDRGTILDGEMFENGINFTASDNAAYFIGVTLTIDKAQELAKKIEKFFAENCEETHAPPTVAK